MTKYLIFQRIIAIGVLLTAILLMCLVIYICSAATTDQNGYFALGVGFTLIFIVFQLATSWASKIIKEWINPAEEYRGILADAESFDWQKKK